MFVYQDGAVFGADVEVDGPNADGDHNVDDKPQPVVSKVPRHVDERSLGEREGLHPKAGLAPPCVQDRPFLQSEKPHE